LLLAGEAQRQDRDVVPLAGRIGRQALDDSGEPFRVSPSRSFAQRAGSRSGPGPWSVTPSV
jgi:hypothetical protein